MLMMIGLTLKSDMVICFCPVFIFQIKYKPLYTIPYKEGQIQQFFLLSRMNKFVDEFYLVKVSKRKNESKEIYRQIVSSKRMSFDFDDVAPSSFVAAHIFVFFVCSGSCKKHIFYMTKVA